MYNVLPKVLAPCPALDLFSSLSHPALFTHPPYPYPPIYNVSFMSLYTFEEAIFCLMTLMTQ
jgi:hypothetical protein